MARRFTADAISTQRPICAPIEVVPAIDAVQQLWLEQSALSHQSVERMGQSLSRFAMRVASQNVTLLAQVNVEHVRGFVHAVLPDGGQPEIATLHARRTALRAFYRAARTLNLSDRDPTMDVVLPGRENKATRPVTEEELLLLRTASLLTGVGRNSVVLALAEATAVTSEISAVRILDLDDASNPVAVGLSGTARHKGRTGYLTTWGSHVLMRRIIELRARGCDEGALLAYGGRAPVGGAKAQASVCNALGELISNVGLDDHQGIRPGSIRAWRGRGIFEEAGLAAAALGLGLSSLDQTALVIDYNWQVADGQEVKR